MKKFKIAIMVFPGLILTGALAATYTLTNPVDGEQGEVRMEDPGGSYDRTNKLSTFHRLLRIGEYGNTLDQLARAVVKFNSGNIVFGTKETVVKATLRPHVSGETLASKGHGSSALLFYSLTDTAISADDFFDYRFILIRTMLGLDSQSEQGAWYEI